ncbi:hypothetical protein BDQ17DRAFT_489631 [Cyathus striatus]|nr:hypothetical protein BDQ17DRAFT_489631 [Cyathus striatus]
MAIRSRNRFNRFLLYSKDPEEISEMTKELAGAVLVFQLRGDISTAIDVVKTQKAIQGVNDKVDDHIVPTMALDKLPCADGASWNRDRVCLPETRVSILNTIWKWINTPDDSANAEIFSVADVVGAGKSTLAHSVAERCYDNKVLGSSFFFDRATADRNTPRKFITTLARALSTLSKDIAQQIALAIDGEPAIVTSPSIRHQFQKLILEPFSLHPVGWPVAVVIDALDEGYDDELLKLLCEEIPKLPSCFRIFITTRPEEDIATLLLQAPHVHRKALDIHDEENLSDIAIYARSRLREVALRKRLGSHWPPEDVTVRFIEMAEGLFLWVSTICDYLLHSTSPDKKLNVVVKDRNFVGIGAPDKMIKVYITILNVCNWDDKDFVEQYGLVMGAIIALKEPLSISALQLLHRNTGLRVSEITYPLASLLAGSTEEGQVLRLPHCSLREFLTRHSLSVFDCQKFYLNENEHSRRLAQLCLKVLIQDLTPDTIGTVHFYDGISYQSLKVKERISEHLYYACCFWISHLTDVQDPVDAEFRNDLYTVLSTRLILWVELSAALQSFQGLKKLRNWIHTELPNDTELHSTIYCLDVAQRLTRISPDNIFLLYGEALEYADDAIEISEWIVQFDPSPDNQAVLAKALNVLALQLADMTYYDKALRNAEKAVALQEKVQQSKRNGADANLAAFLTTLEKALSGSGNRKAAIATINRVVELYTELAALDPNQFKHLLVNSLSTLSDLLARDERKMDAIQIIQKECQLIRELAVEGFNILGLSLVVKIVFKQLVNMDEDDEALELMQFVCIRLRSDLVTVHVHEKHIFVISLQEISEPLAIMKKSKKALGLVEELMDIVRQAAEEFDSWAVSVLVNLLNTLSEQLSAAGKLEDALHAAKESVELCRWGPVFRNMPGSLYSLAHRYADLNRPEEALQAANEFINILRDRRLSSNTNSEHLAKVLELVTKLHSGLGRPDEEKKH